MAKRLAGEVLAETGDRREDFVGGAFRRALGRAPTAREIEASRAFLERQQGLLRGEKRVDAKLALPSPSPKDIDPHAAAALVDLCLALYNTSEFIYLD